MWKPANPNALPSEKDIFDANEAIQLVEAQMVDALLAVEQAQLRVAELEKELLQRRAWLSPVRKLTLDALTYIFEHCAEDDWKAPLRLGAVSRLWRECVISSPCAWDLPPINRRISRDLVDLYLERSGRRLLHLGIFPKPTPSFLKSIKDRVQCLSTFRLPVGLEDTVFPHVTRLFIRWNGGMITPFSINKAHLPSLRHLECHAHLIRTSGTPADVAGFFDADIAPLETLAIFMSDDTTWISIVNSCAPTLISLKVGVYRQPLTVAQSTATRHYSIVLPKLKSLSIVAKHITTNRWSLRLSTPVLESYIEEIDNLRVDRPLHADLSTVTHMRIGHMLKAPLEQCISLRRLQLINGLHQVYPLLTRLTSDSSLCPDLEAIEAKIVPRFALNEDELATRLEELHSKREGLVQVLNEYSGDGTFPWEMKRTVGLNHILDVLMLMLSVVWKGHVV